MESNNNKTLKIALDAMGGDFAPDNEIKGAIKVFSEKDPGLKLEIILVGDEKKINDALARFDKGNLVYSIVHADEVITMEDEPTAAIKKKRNSSLYKGYELIQNGKADAFVSAGNTGAMLSTGTILLGRVNGVSRPTIGSFFPTINPQPALVLDVGANVDCKPHFIYEFAVMGDIYCREILGIEKPKVGLLNIGEESKKGNEVTQQAYALLKKSDLNFIGNVEGTDILKGTADVVVCDGFTGNVILKFAESIITFLKTKVRMFGERSFMNKVMVAIMAPTLRKILKEFDYQNYGGVPLLGVNGVAIIGHGKSSPKAIQNMLLKAVEIVRRDVNKKIEQALNQNTISEQL